MTRVDSMLLLALAITILSSVSAAAYGHTIEIIPDTFPPNVTLTSPANGTTYTANSQIVNFLFNVTDDSQLTSCTVFALGNTAINATNASAITKGILNSINITLTPSSYNAYVNCTDIAGNIGKV